MSNILIRNISHLAGIMDGVATPLKGSQMQTINSLENAFVYIENERIVDYGTMDRCKYERAEKVIDASSKTILPAWCDSHTHIVYAGSREQEFVNRIKGMGYEEIAQQGGGILNSARKLQDTPEEVLFESAWTRLNEIRSYGTGAVEIKSGYGLTKESELKMLRVIKRLKEESGMLIRSTFLGAHAFPMEYKQNRTEYIRLLTEEMIPQIADEGLADYCDVFCERGFFTAEESDIILKAGQRYGLKSKVHANELAISGGVQVGVANNAISVDHLECIGEEEISILKNGSTMPNLLPSTAFFLAIEYAPARKLIDSGLPVALASDYNPGTTPSGKMSFVLSLACIHMKMLPEEAINAATINGAFAMEAQNEVGRIAKGMRANLILTKEIPSLAYLPYSFGSDLIETVVLEGKVIK